MTSPWKCARIASTPRRFGHFSAWIVNGRGSRKLVLPPPRPVTRSGLKVTSSPRTGIRPSARTLAGFRPLRYEAIR